MSALLAYIVWSVSPEIFWLGSWPVRWYGLFFALAFLLGQYVLIKIYKAEGRSEKDVEVLTIYMVIAVIVGARLGHVLFYQPLDYLRNPIEIFEIWNGGLASHGAAAGILIAIYLYTRKHKGQSYLYVLDRLVIVIALAGFFIRMGNLMNSEILGEATNFPTAVVFVQDVESAIENFHPVAVEEASIVKNQSDTVINDLKLQGIDINVKFDDQVQWKDTLGEIMFELYRTRSFNELVQIPAQPEVVTSGSSVTIKAFGVPRHPAQFYEAFSSLLIFLFLLYLYSKKKSAMPEGRLFGFFTVILFSLRFLYEFLKEPQVGFEENMVLNMGQILSIPLVLAGLFILMKSYRKKGEIS